MVGLTLKDIIKKVMKREKKREEQTSRRGRCLLGNKRRKIRIIVF